ncbi:MAG: radical SAM protein [Verrucomicrobia bacterium]|nr:MAG: radical SAM protein [Verrucomicrobiota bacterium]
MTRFEAELGKHALALRRARLQTLQVNVGRKCNQTCRHCHVDAAPWRTEMMDAKTAWRVAAWIERHRPPVVDITGGAPELSEYFRFLVEVSRGSDCHVIDRNNLTIIETGAFGWLPEYLAAHEVEVVASLPCYLEENVNAQRGNGVFEKSIRALRKLNAVGYGRRLALNLVYNPLGPKLPPPQAELEADYKTELGRRYGIKFTRLYTITNQPINRFAQDLREHDQWDAYLELLANSFNPATVEGLMCRTTLSVGWRGEVYDCDFNQMLEMQIRNGAGTAPSPSNFYKKEKENHGDEAVPAPLYLWEVTPEQLEGREIQTGIHCLACTAGCGSSCTGAVDESTTTASVA